MIRFIFGVLFIITAIPLAFIARAYKQRAKLLAAATAGGKAPARTNRWGEPLTDTSGEIAGYLRIARNVTFTVGALLIVWSTVRVVPANHVGIPTQFGSIGESLDSGFQFTTPWTEIHQFSTRMQELSLLGGEDSDGSRDDSIEVRGKDGYVMWADVTIRYFIEGDSASALFRLVGSEGGVKDRLVRPEVREAVRVQFAKYTAEEGYTSQRDAIRGDIFDDLAVRLERYGLRLDSVAVRNVAPDPVLANAISERAAARERALQATIQQGTDLTLAETRKLVAETDAAAKVAAAQGEADANRILAASITEEILMLKRIEALRDANTVYVPDETQILVSAAPRTTT